MRVTGDQAHSGAAEMADRRDALLGAARLITAARDLVDDFAPGDLHTACGEINVYPNSPVVVASEVTLLIDLRSPHTEVLDAAFASLEKTIAEVSERDRLQIEIIGEHRWEQNPYPENGIALAREVAAELELTHDRVMTVAGHDSTNMKDVAPTVMLFVPSVSGISHNLREYTSDEDMLAGLAHLAGVVTKLAKDGLDRE